jgi:hypothetical protein
MIVPWSNDDSPAETATVRSNARSVQSHHLSNLQLGYSHKIFLLGVSRRDVLRLDARLLWARRLCLACGLGSLHDLHVRLDGQMIGKGVTCCVVAMWRMIDRRTSDGRESPLDWPCTCPSVAHDFVGAS